MSKSHRGQWVVRETPERAPVELVWAFGELPTTQIADSGGPVGVVGPGIGAVAGGRELCGSAMTVWVKPGDILMILKAAELCRPGDVVVVDGGGRLDAAVVGDIFTGCVARAGGVGIVVDGAVRDLDGIDEVGVPVFARGAHPATGSNEGPGAVGVEVQLGGVAVRPGDIVRGDRSGVVVVPREHAEEVLRLTREVAARETAWRARISDGETLAAATGVDAVLAGRAAPGAEPLHLP